MKTQNRAPAFTLIEVLVVVAIIALLVAILLPSLANARNQAKLVIDKANCSQIAGATMMYQAESKSYVPIVYNHWAYQGSGWDKPARTCALSIALRMSMKGLANLKNIDGGRFDPDKTWDWATITEYQNRLMPEFFVCPYERGKGNGRMTPERRMSDFYTMEWEGRFDSYHTWLWATIKKGMSNPDPGVNLPSNRRPSDYTPQYSVLTWNTGISKDPNHITNFRHKRWELGEARKMGAPSLSDVTVAFCAQGEHTQWGFGSPYSVRRPNVGSHYTSMGGGTNAVFADGHVAWVVGTRIGWP